MPSAERQHTQDMRPERPFVMSTLLLGLAFALACCSSTQSAPPAPSIGSNPPTSSPLHAVQSEIYGATGTSPEELDARFHAEEMRIQEKIALCMNEAGFTYVPYVGVQVAPDLGLPADLTPLERARLVGYGEITTFRLGPVTLTDPSPNTALRDALSPQGQREYDAALGLRPAVVDYSTADSNPSPDGDPVPCINEDLFADLSDGDPLGDDPIWNDFIADEVALSGRIEADQRIIDLDARWSECIAEAGYPDLDSPGYARSLAIQPFSEWRQGALLPDGSVPRDDPELDRLETFEVSIAVADFTCQETLSYADSRNAITWAYEQQFVDAHADDIAYLTQSWADSVASNGESDS